MIPYFASRYEGDDRHVVGRASPALVVSHPIHKSKKGEPVVSVPSCSETRFIYSPLVIRSQVILRDIGKLIFNLPANLGAAGLQLNQPGMQVREDRPDPEWRQCSPTHMDHKQSRTQFHRCYIQRI